MSPLIMALLGYVAFKGIKHLTSSGTEAPASPKTSTPPKPAASAMPAGSAASAAPAGSSDSLTSLLGGGLGGLLSGGLGSLMASGSGGAALSNGLGQLLEQFQQSGQGDKAKSWVGTGPNKDISEQELAKAMGDDDIDSLSENTGMSRDDLLSALRKELPNIVDQLTPDGRVPAAHEMTQRTR
jgi:uncharacterized protein YidB (DUF937 family)